MTYPVQPREWASDTNYSSGSASGTATKTDPGAALSGQGFIPGTAGAQHFNHTLNSHSLTSRYLLTEVLRSECRPRLNAGMTLAAASNAAVVSQGHVQPAVVLNAGDSPWYVRDDAVNESGGAAIPSITGAILGSNGAFNPTTGRLVCVGSGGNRVAYSDDQGQTWSTGANLGGTGLSCIWNPTYSRFVALVTNAALYSADASAAWTSVAVTNSGRGIGLQPNGTMYLASAGGPLTTRVSTNGGTSWASGPVPTNAADFTDQGSVAGAGLDYVWHAGIRAGGDGKIQISRIEPGGSSWTTLAELDKIDAGSFSGTCIIRQCIDSGLLALNVGIGSLAHALYASADGGVSWTRPLMLRQSVYGAGSMSLAHGKIFLADSNAQLFMSDGIGWV